MDGAHGGAGSPGRDLSAGWAIDRASGTYALFLQSGASESEPVGTLGRISLRPGYYAYVGSALGPGGLQARIARHLDSTRPRHWHVDYLKRATRIVEVWYVVDPVRREHAWASAFGSLSKASIPMNGFGSSDCNCRAHLFRFPTKPTLASFERVLARTRGSGKGPIRTFRPPARSGGGSAIRSAATASRLDP